MPLCEHPLNSLRRLHSCSPSCTVSASECGRDQTRVRYIKTWSRPWTDIPQRQRPQFRWRPVDVGAHPPRPCKLNSILDDTDEKRARCCCCTCKGLHRACAYGVPSRAGDRGIWMRGTVRRRFAGHRDVCFGVGGWEGTAILPDKHNSRHSNSLANSQLTSV